ncbi:MAG TPA: hypothetical protein VF796_07185 [Humisphaera sp.]
MPADFVEHRVKQTGASVRAPATWRSVPIEGDRLGLSSSDGKSVMGLIVADPDPEADAASVVRNRPKELEAEHPGVAKVTSAEVVRFGKFDAARIVVDMRGPQGGVVRMCNVTVNTKAHQYVFFFADRPDPFDAALPVFEQIVSSAVLP